MTLIIYKIIMLILIQSFLFCHEIITSEAVENVTISHVKCQISTLVKIKNETNLCTVTHT